VKLFRTRNQGCAAALRYALGPAAHLKTYREPRGVTFLFQDTAGECRELARQFFGDHGEGPLGVTDARGLIDDFFAIRQTMAAAIASPDGQWSNDAADGENDNDK
jgi:hypothetical protein